jgi:DNA polymerase
MRWAILTPYRSLHWDGEKLHFSDGVAAAQMPEDELETLWLSYYRATFNPARIKLKAMIREMPVRHWPTLPETRLIPQLLAEAPQRVAQMVRQNQMFNTSAADFIPAAADLAALAAAAPSCRGCGLYRCAGRTVFGEGPAAARIMLIGEQPGDAEDRAGRPFVGPAGQLLDQLLAEAGLERSMLYLSNAVKHFKFSEANRRRIHRSPSMHDIQACRPWLEAEIAALRPQRILALGVSAARARLGAGATLQELRGRWHCSDQMEYAGAIRVSYHPAAILRAGDEGRRQTLYQALLQDLKQIAGHDA